MYSGAQADFVEQLPHARVGRGALGDLVDRQSFAHDRADGHARIERRERILEDDLDLAAQLPHRARVERDEVHAVELHACRRSGSMRRRIIRPVVDLPQPDSPTRPSVSPGITSNDTPSTARTTPAGLPNTPFLIGKCLTRSRTDRERLTLGACGS